MLKDRPSIAVAANVLLVYNVMTQNATCRNCNKPAAARDQMAKSVHSLATGSGSRKGIQIKQHNFSGIAGSYNLESTSCFDMMHLTRQTT